ncbi:MAG: hypothetical protein JWO90_2330 [Solirubrobacterales bacterium]|nr:hypothetical protein [Solirubrobacterales bacterium]
MDLLLLLAIAGTGAVVALVGAARLHPGSGADLLDWDSGRDVGRRLGADADDLADMLAAHNARRREQGLGPRTEEDLRVLLDAERHERRSSS